VTDLVEFVRARLDERAVQIQLLLVEMPPTVVWQSENKDAGVFECLGLEVNGAKTFRRYWTDGDAIDWGWHMHESAVELHSHAEAERTLHDVQAKRRIVAMYVEDEYGYTRVRFGDFESCSDSCPGTVMDEVLKLLALPFVDHPDYRPEWLPETVVPPA